jgi:transglutaminase-like putative cysteine protease
MSGLVARPVPVGPALESEGRPLAAPRAATAGESLPLRLACFAALALFGALHWARFVTDAPVGRTFGVVAVATAGGALVALTGRLPVHRALVVALALLAGLLTLLVGLAMAGLPVRLFAPGHWPELWDGLDRGLAGIQNVDWPYDGAEEWIRLTILLGTPFLLAIAATLGFFPARRSAAVFRGAALIVLLLLYGTAVTEHDPGRPLLRGLALLVLVAAWLWLPRLRGKEAGVAAAAVVGVGICALPLAAGLDNGKAWWDYGAWNIFGPGKSIRFNWTHEYGPLDWPREGTTLLNVKSEEPHYWKAETLDSFDGFRWVRTNATANIEAGAEIPGRDVPAGRKWSYGEFNPKWDVSVRFTVRSLSTNFVLGAGITYKVDGVRAFRPSSDGTTVIAEPLEKGDVYTAHSYAPDPSADQMRDAPAGYDGGYLTYTEIRLPNPGESAISGTGLQGDAARSAAIENRRRILVPLRDTPSDPDAQRLAARALEQSPYARMYAETQRITANADTSYDVVKGIENYLQDNLIYQERVPSHDYPLEAFLFQDKAGYCQQFSGAMALMLRMSGVPARVAAGFSPGSYNKDTEEYRVRDLDAHSWVEVYFTGIGWVPFDPTPTAAPAESQSTGIGSTSAARLDAGEVKGGPSGSALSERGTDTGGGGGSGGGLPGWVVPLIVVGLLAFVAAGLLFAGRVRRRRGLGTSELADAQLAELRAALEKLGWDVPAATTLLALERRLGRAAGPASARYAAGLRANRYDPRTPSAPGGEERRAVRRELSAGGGLRARLLGLLAIPPGGPRPV